MAHVNDAKFAKMFAAAQVGFTGTSDDMELFYAMFLAGGTPGVSPRTTTVEWWMDYFDDLLIPAGHFDDRAYAWLGGLGYTGTISDRWAQYWSAP